VRVLDVEMVEYADVAQPCDATCNLLSQRRRTHGIVYQARPGRRRAAEGLKPVASPPKAIERTRVVLREEVKASWVIMSSDDRHHYVLRCDFSNIEGIRGDADVRTAERCPSCDGQRSAA